MRYIVRGTRGTYLKYGVDIQEDQLKAIQNPQEVFELSYGKEPESLWGTVENVQDDGVTFSQVTSGFSLQLLPRCFADLFIRWPSDNAGCYTDLFRNLAAAIREGADLLVPWKDAQTVIELIELAHKSSKEERTLDVPPA